MSHLNRHTHTHTPAQLITMAKLVRLLSQFCVTVCRAMPDLSFFRGCHAPICIIIRSSLLKCQLALLFDLAFRWNCFQFEWRKKMESTIPSHTHTHTSGQRTSAFMFTAMESDRSYFTVNLDLCSIKCGDRGYVQISNSVKWFGTTSN